MVALRRLGAPLSTFPSDQHQHSPLSPSWLPLVDPLRISCVLQLVPRVCCPTHDLPHGAPCSFPTLSDSLQKQTSIKLCISYFPSLLACVYLWWSESKDSDTLGNFCASPSSAKTKKLMTVSGAIPSPVYLMRYAIFPVQLQLTQVGRGIFNK